MGSYSERIRLLERRYRNTPKSEWRRGEYRAFIDKVKDKPPFNDSITVRVEWLINNVKLKDLHGSAGYEAIILALAYYMCREDGGNPPLGRYRVFREYGVDEKLVITVLSNLLRWYRSREPTCRGRGVAPDRLLGDWLCNDEAK